MSIVNQRAVLLLGAGVSAPFGVPLGDKMIDMVAEALRKECQLLRKGDHPAHRLRGAITDSTEFPPLAIHATVCAELFAGSATGDPGGRLQLCEKLAALRDLLRDQTSETIDDFIVENPTYAAETKAAIAALVLLSLYQIGQPMMLRDPAARRVFVPDPKATDPGARNWIHLFINIVRQGIRDGLVSNSNKVEVLTFNYDTLLEHVLAAQFSNTERKYGSWSDYVRVTHMHGQLGSLSKEERHPAYRALEWSRGIYVVNEDGLSQGVVEARNHARSVIANAQEIYVAGFAFAKPNLDKIGLTSDWKRHHRKIVFCNYDGNRGVALAAQRLESSFTAVQEVPGESDRPISVEAWFKGGYAGDLPG